MEWPRAHAGASNVTGVLRSTCDDFRVTESLPFEPVGEGEHLYIFAEKRGVTTNAVQKMLARSCQVPARDVSYAGMKDRHAVARQWFSVRLPRGEEIDLGQDVRILRCARHRRKLRRGELEGNHFRIRIRALAGNPETSLAQLRATGAPNYFGEQRFGATGGNVAAAIEWMRAGKPGIPPFLRSVYLSSLRSFLFNEVLAKRVTDGTWRCLMDGEADLDGLPTGPLWGRGRLQSTGAARGLEECAIRSHHEIALALEHVGLRQQRRALAAIPKNLSWRLDDDALTVEFSLGPGAYATMVLREVGEFHDAVREAKAAPVGAASA
ncbi:MAG: tRNA pseudouridine(13) synthase TruD [Gammaproteobacteria bacterium]|nr:tRNA pseudouridine(13) synthase TruD [Gammaproteobacteria bacterium]MDE0224459.1 tRNA pseudouridine(13) synthase TruD [Gammaproteobacteria bacterium]